MKKIKWLNVMKSIIFILCVYMILHDLYMLTIYSTITGKLYGWTWLGFITFILFFVVASMIYDGFKEEIKKSGDTTHATATHVNN